MALNFPDNPQNGDTFSGPIKSWTYNSSLSAWTSSTNTVVNPVRTNLTGNGVLSSFSVGGADNLVNPSALIVAIDGVLQEPVVDYTVSSGNITFTSPLPSGSKAVVISPTNTLQVSQNIPADGSVTSAKLDNSIAVAGNLSVAGKLTANGQGSLSSLNNNDVITKSLMRNRESITYYGGDLVNYSVFNGGLYTLQNPANYWQKGVLLRDAQTDALNIPVPKNWDSTTIRVKVYAARSGGTASLKDFVLYQRSRYMPTPIGEQSQFLSDLNTSTITRSFSGGSNSICLNFQIDFIIRPYDDNEVRLIQLQRLGNDVSDTMDTSLIIYQIDLTQI